VDLVYSVFDFGTKPFIELREKIWMMVFQKAKEERSGKILSKRLLDTKYWSMRGN
jgi:hypothetical protein